MATKKNTELKIVKITHEEQEYTARWNTRAFRQFLAKFKNAQTNEIDGKEVGIKFGLSYIEIAYDVLDGMLIRAGMSEDAIGNIDVDQYAREATNLLSWFQETMTLLNNGGADEKNSKAVAAAN